MKVYTVLNHIIKIIKIFVCLSVYSGQSVERLEWLWRDFQWQITDDTKSKGYFFELDFLVWNKVSSERWMLWVEQ